MTSAPEQPEAAGAATHVLLGRLARQYVHSHLWRLAVAGLCMIVVAATTAANAWLLEPVLDEVFLNRNERLLYVLPAVVLVLALAKGFATYGQAVLMSTVGQRIIATVQIDLFAHLMRADLAYFHRITTGRLISSFLNDVNLLNDAVSKALTGIVKDSLTLAFLIGLLFYQDWRLALITCVVLPAAILPVRNLGKRMRRASAETQVRTGRFSAILTETFHGARHIKAYGMEAREAGRATRAIEDRLAAIFKVVRTRALATPVVETLGAVAVALVILYGGARVIAGATTPGTFFSFMAALIMAYQPLRSLANLNAALQEGLAAAQRIFALLDVEPEIRERVGAEPLRLSGGSVTFDDVWFAYEPGKPALNGVTLCVSAGRSVALVGPSGAGKSTFVNLIARFYDADRGTVAIDGTDVRAATLSSVRGAIALVSQEATLFDDTVRANISYGRVGASEDEIVTAARDAAADEFITRLPQGYDTLVGENGVTLSGGQRQRIAIARAMLKNAPILLLDEATSALDFQSERQVQAALNRLMKGRTTLIIAHRLSTVADADEIHVIEDGRVVESGRHGELLARRGAYAHLYAEQTEKYAAGEAPARAQG